MYIHIDDSCTYVQLVNRSVVPGLQVSVLVCAYVCDVVSLLPLGTSKTEIRVCSSIITRIDERRRMEEWAAVSFERAQDVDVTDRSLIIA